MNFFIIPTEWLPIQLVALVSLGMGIAFIAADARSPTSRALALAFVAFGVAVGLGLPLNGHGGEISAAGRWLAVADSVALIASLEWVRRVRRTIDVEHLHVGISDVLLWLGQLAGLFFGAAGVYAPELRRDQFLSAVSERAVLFEPGFWIFALPLFFAIFAGGVASVLLLLARPDRSERIRIIGALIGFPMIVSGLIIPAKIGAIIIIIGLMVFLIGAMQYVVVQGQRGQFLARFMSPQVEKLVRSRGFKHAVQHRTLEITVISSDLRGFTLFAQTHPSSSVIRTLREYYDAVGNVVMEHGATIKDYAGDGILILVGAPLPIEKHAQRALQMAAQIRTVSSEVTRRWSTNAYPLGVGVGVASGLVTVGIIGSASRWEYTAVGPAVNLASRLCERALDGEILVDSRTAEMVQQAGLTPLSPIALKGFAEPVEIHNLGSA